MKRKLAVEKEELIDFLLEESGVSEEHKEIREFLSGQIEKFECGGDYILEVGEAIFEVHMNELTTSTIIDKVVQSVCLYSVRTVNSITKID